MFIDAANYSEHNTPANSSVPGEGGQVASGLLVTGFAVAAVTGYVALRLLLGLVRRHSLWPFAIYCWAMGLFSLVMVAVR